MPVGVLVTAVTIRAGIVASELLFAPPRASIAVRDLLPEGRDRAPKNGARGRVRAAPRYCDYRSVRTDEQRTIVRVAPPAPRDILLRHAGGVSFPAGDEGASP